jgi:hypothetical protein
MNDKAYSDHSDGTRSTQVPQPARKLALASLIVGIAAILLLAIPAGIVAISLGVKAKRLGHTTPMPKIAVALGAVSIVISLFVYMIMGSYLVNNLLPTLYPGIFQKPEETTAELTAEEIYDFTLREDGTYALAVPDGIRLSGLCAIPAQHDGIAVTAISDGGFSNQTALSRVILPDSIRIIGDRAFENCDHIFSLTLSSELSSIGQSAFEGCAALEALTIPEGVTEIKAGAFAGCAGLGQIILPPSLTRIEADLLRDCAALTRVVIPSGVVFIGSYAFSGCQELTKLTLPDGVDTLESYAFAGCAKLTRINLPQGVTAISDGLFLGCAALREMPVHNGVTRIGSRGFADCFLLREMILPLSVAEIGEEAFDGCPNLFKLQYVGTMAEWEQVRKPAVWPDTMQRIDCADGSIRLT